MSLFPKPFTNSQGHQHLGVVNKARKQLYLAIVLTRGVPPFLLWNRRLVTEFCVLTLVRYQGRSFLFCFKLFVVVLSGGLSVIITSDKLGRRPAREWRWNCWGIVIRTALSRCGDRCKPRSGCPFQSSIQTLEWNITGKSLSSTNIIDDSFLFDSAIFIRQLSYVKVWIMLFVWLKLTTNPLKTLRRQWVSEIYASRIRTNKTKNTNLFDKSKNNKLILSNILVLLIFLC